MPNITARRRNHSQTAIRGTITMLPCWPKGRFEPKLWPTGTSNQVVSHKETFYPSAWARYDLARPGSFRLVPVENRVAALERDYRNMSVMIFGDAPKFDWIMETLRALEQEINR